MAFKKVSRVEVIEILRRWQAGTDLTPPVDTSANCSPALVSAYSYCAWQEHRPAANHKVRDSLYSKTSIALRRSPTRPPASLADPLAEF